MQSVFGQDTTFTWRDKPYLVSAELKQMLVVAAIITVIWWIVGLVRPLGTNELRWGDQQLQYLTGLDGLRDPYAAQGFFNPPWTLIIMFPFNFVPFEVAILLQGILYHSALVLITFKFSPSKMTQSSRRLAALAILTSPFVADFAVEINNDWVPTLGLLVPPIWSPIFILAKPQNAIGYFFSFNFKTLMRAILVGSVTMLVSFVIWGIDWPLRAINSIERDQLGFSFSAAPPDLIGWVPSLAIGVLLLGYVLYRVYGQRIPPAKREEQQRDLALYAVVAGLFFVPYIAGYSLALIYALLAAKVPRITLGINVIIWIATISLLLPILI